MKVVKTVDLDRASRDELIDCLSLAEDEIKFLRGENRQLGEQVEALEAEVAQLKEEIKALEKARAKAAVAPHSKGKKTPKSERKKPGRKGRINGDKGPFNNRPAPEIKPTDEVERLNAPLKTNLREQGTCPKCGKELNFGTDEASTTDAPEHPKRIIRIFEVETATCNCGFCQRGEHEELPAGQHGATAHRVGPQIMAASLHQHNGIGTPLRKVPGIIEAHYDITITQSALTQCALKLGGEGGAVAKAAEEIRHQIINSDRVHTDDTGWKIDGESAFLMGFGSDDAAYYQIGLCS